MRRRSIPVFLLISWVSSCALCEKLDVPAPDASQDADTGTDACVRESTEEFCDRAGKDCGIVTADDNCGLERRLDCGVCEDGSVCGEVEPNICGCPCSIEGSCELTGAVNAADPCLVCDPSRSDAAWSIAEGAECDDGDPCTTSSTCSSDGACDADPAEPACAALDTDCQVGVCDAMAEACVAEPRDDGTPCTDDGLTCTTDRCIDGACVHEAVSDACLIGGTCFQPTQTDPDDPCRACIPASDPAGFTALAAGSFCDDGDGLACTGGTCDDAGACVSAQLADTCLVEGVCAAPGDPNPDNPCEVCDPVVASSAWTAAAGGTVCATTSCTQGSCSLRTCQNEVLVAGFCLIDDLCYAADETEPNSFCHVCDPSSSPTAWSDLPNDTQCSAIGSCACEAGICRRPNGTVCP